VFLYLRMIRTVCIGIENKLFLFFIYLFTSKSVLIGDMSHAISVRINVESTTVLSYSGLDLFTKRQKDVVFNES
jgi:hypothetical protein